jgi:hypothetical protein
MDDRALTIKSGVTCNDEIRRNENGEWMGEERGTKRVGHESKWDDHENNMS